MGIENTSICQYLIPDRQHRTPGDTHAVHINDAGRPLCGAELTEPYRADDYRYAYNTCPACERVRTTGQMELLR